MARVVETIVAIKLSRIVKDSSEDASAVSPDVMLSIVEGIPQLVEGIVDDPAVVVEVMELE